MKQFFRINITWLVAYAIIFIGMIIALCVVPKAELHLGLNAYHNSGLDWLFRYYTQFVDWPMYALIFLLLLYKIGYGAFVAAVQVMSTIIIHIIKPLANMPRPLTYFTEIVGNPSVLPLVEGVKMHHWKSFPSGHTAAFFAFFLPLAVVISYDIWRTLSSQKQSASKHKLIACKLGVGCMQLAFLFLALLGAYSRIYLSQHFLLDICVGSVISVFSTIVIAYIFIRCEYFEAPWFGARLPIARIP